MKMMFCALRLAALSGLCAIVDASLGIFKRDGSLGNVTAIAAREAINYTAYTIDQPVSLDQVDAKNRGLKL
jgi:hypothetical protein